MPISDKEIARRIGAIREKMRDKGLQALIVFSQVILGEKGAVRYISDYRLLTRKDYLVLPLSGDPMLIVPTLGQKMSALQVSWIKDVRSGGETAGMIREVAEKIKSDRSRKRGNRYCRIAQLCLTRTMSLKKELPGSESFQTAVNFSTTFGR